jgi:hypothetical protein
MTGNTIMKKIIRILLIGLFGVLPTLVQAQGTRKIKCTISAPEISAGVAMDKEESFTCYVYSIYAGLAEQYIKAFEEHRIVPMFD